MKRFAFWVYLLLQVLSFSSSHGVVHAAEVQKNAPVGKDAQVALQSQTDIPGDHGQAVREEGAELVDEAIQELDRIPKWSYKRAAKSSSIFVKIFDFIMQSLPSGPTMAPTEEESPSPAIKGPLLNAVRLLEQAATRNNSDALSMLADFNFFGNYSHPRDLHKAFDRYKELATSRGNTTAQFMLGLYYSTGLAGVVPRNQATALLYYTVAAARGDIRAEMAMGFRHHSGIGATKSCPRAIKHYKRVADKAIAWYRSGPPGGRSWVPQSWRIVDDDGGVYGEGASASSSGIHAYKPSPQSDAYAAVGDVMEYLDFLSRKGDWAATLDLGRRYYEGRHNLAQDFDLAKKYFFLVASKYWRRDGRLVETPKQGIERIAGRAAGYLGKMYLRGDGFAQNFDKAGVWFERGKMHSDPQSLYGLGLMYLNGLGRKRNVKLAVEMFSDAAEQDYSPARVQIGQLHLDEGKDEDLQIANNHFEKASRYGNIEAIYYLAEMSYHGVGREKLCGTAINYYKNVAERAEPLVSPWTEANEAYESGDLETALLEYLMAAEQGYEKAQTNVAWMLDKSRSSLPTLDWLSPQKAEPSLLDNPELALIYWTRSSRQMNVDSLVKMGDYYLNGIGSEADVAKAVQCYTGAAEYSQSAQAIFNLGWMHENGVGLNQDFHLAKRHYDAALEVSEEAFLPVTLSLLKLRLRSAWNTLTNGPIHSIQDEPSTKQDWSLSEWLENLLQPVEWEYEEEDDYTNGMYGSGIVEDDEDWEDDGILESLLIIGLTMSLVVLLWWRQRIQQARAQAEEARRREQGLPPHPAPPANQPGFGAANFQGWAGGGMGM